MIHRVTPYLLAGALLAGCSYVPFVGKGSGSTAKELPTLAPIAEKVAVKRLWSTDVGSGSKDPSVKLEPALGAGRVFVTDGAGRVGAYDAASGKRVWRVETKDAVSGGAGFGEGLVLVGTREGVLVALAADDGKQRWRAQLSSEILAAPAAGSGMVVARTGDDKVFGVAPDSGDVRWVYERTVPALSLRGTGSPVIAGDTVLSGFASGRIVANEVVSGHVRWEYTVAQARGRNEIERLVDVDAEPLVHEGMLYTSAFQGVVSAVDLRTGRALWSRDYSSVQQLAADESRLYISATDGRVVALDLRTGETRWEQETLKGRATSGPVLANGYVVVVDVEGTMHVLSPNDGALVGRLRGVAEKAAVSEPVGDGTRVYILQRDGDLAAYTIG